MFITLAKVNTILNDKSRLVHATSVYGHGDFICEVLYANIHISIGTFILVFVMDNDSYLKNYAIPLPRSGNNIHSLYSIKMNYYNSEIDISDNRISIFIADDGMEGNIDTEQRSIEGNFLNMMINPINRNYTTEYNRDIRYTEIELTRNNVEIGKYANGKKYSYVFLDKEKIDIEKYSANDAPPPLCENAEIVEEQEQEENQNSLTPESALEVDPDPIPDTYLRSKITLLDDYISIKKLESNDTIRDEIKLSDDYIKISYKYNDNLRTNIRLDCDNIKFVVNKLDDEFKNLSEVRIRENKMYLAKFDEDGNKNAVIYIDDTKTTVASYNAGNPESVLELKGGDITIKSKDKYLLESGEIEVNGDPQPSSTPTGGFCQILYCPITGLPHTTNKLIKPTVSVDDDIDLQ
ncbi:MAG: hypothetical protein QXF12_00105 [Candidatus Aenigmatarchaeota archaeon]